MRNRHRRLAFSWLDLLVALAVIAMLMAILLPSLLRARQVAMRAVCLSNLRSLAQASYAYATDDQCELLLPIHRQMVRPTEHWYWKTVNAFAWGGRSAPEAFRLSASESVYLNNVAGQGRGTLGGAYAASTRPLNLYVYGDVAEDEPMDLKLYHCPEDRGYPAQSATDDSPPANAGRPCYDTLGNSYRGNMLGLYGKRGEAFAVGPWGHRGSAIENPMRTVLYADPLFIRATTRDGEGRFPTGAFTGWHRRRGADNVTFCDGSARMTKIEQLAQFDAATLKGMDVSRKNGELLVRGRTFQMDMYPIPAARIWGKWEDLTDFGAYNRAQWPFAQLQDNLKVSDQDGR